MVVFFPMVIFAVSPLITTPCHMLEPLPKLTSPTTVAFGAIQSP